MAPVERIRNRNLVPYLENEGEILKPLDLLGVSPGSGWSGGLAPHDRLHIHHTLASVRRYSHYKPCPGLIPQDNLDFKLDSSYEHGTEMFPDTIDTVLQPETRGIETWRRLQNTRDIGSSSVPSCKDRKKMLKMIDMEKEKSRSHGKQSKPRNMSSEYYTGYSPLIKDIDDKGMCTDILKIYTKPYNKYHPVKIGGILERRHPANIKLMNASHHSPQTNAGFKRKDGDGNLFEY